jgi:hypothetical protein
LGIENYEMLCLNGQIVNLQLWLEQYSAAGERGERLYESLRQAGDRTGLAE